LLCSNGLGIKPLIERISRARETLSRPLPISFRPELRSATADKWMALPVMDPICAMRMGASHFNNRASRKR